MKASDVTKIGFYWYTGDGDSTIVHADLFASGKLTFTFTGNEIDRDAEEMPGNFIGPLDQPT